MEAGVKVLLYGRLSDAIGREIDVGAVDTVAEVRRRLATDYPAVSAALRRSRSFVRDQLVADDFVPQADDVIEFLPPVSGG